MITVVVKIPEELKLIIDLVRPLGLENFRGLVQTIHFFIAATAFSAHFSPSIAAETIPPA